MGKVISTHTQSTTLSTTTWFLGQNGDSTYYKFDLKSIFNPMTNTADLIYGGASGVATVLAAGLANQKLFINASTTTPEWATGISIISFTRIMNSTTGNVSYTGAGFKPTAMIVLAGSNDEISIGFASSATNGCVSVSGSAANVLNFHDNVLYITDTIGANQKSTVASWDNDGVTLTWTYTAAHSTVTSDGRILFFR